MRLLDYLATRLPEKDIFLAKHHCGILLHRPFDAPEEQRTFETISASIKWRRKAEFSVEAHPDLMVTPIQKRLDAIFSGHVSVGRTRTSDIRIPHADVSKFHAYFAVDPSGGHTLTDAGSMNGTFVNDVRVARRETVPITDGVVIYFAHYHIRFHLPAGFYAMLSELARQMSR